MENSLESRGPIYINRIRFSLTFFYLLAVVISYKVNTFGQMVGYLSGISTMLFYASLQSFFSKSHKLKSVHAKLFIIFDIVILTAVVIIGMSGNTRSASIVMRSTILYSISYFYIAYSAFLFSASFVIIAGFTAFLCGISISFFGYYMGLRFDETGLTSGNIDSISISNEINEGLFLLIFTVIIYLVIKLLLAMRNESEEKHKEAMNVNQQLQKNKEKISNTIEHIQLSSEKLSQFINDFNDEIQQQAASFEEIHASIVEFATHSQRFSELVNEQNLRVESMTSEANALEEIILSVSNATVNLQKGMGSGKEYNETVTNSVNHLNEALQELDLSFGKVKEVTQIMAEIADRTNLLSLNASIEAARAGEHGRGFSVVASEVGKLAESSSQNADMIKKIIQLSNKHVQSGREVAKAVNEKVLLQEHGVQDLEKMAIKLSGQIKNQEDINLNMIDSLKSLKKFSTEIEFLSSEQKNAINGIQDALTDLNRGISKLTQQSSSLMDSIQGLNEESLALQS